MMRLPMALVTGLIVCALCATATAQKRPERPDRGDVRKRVAPSDLRRHARGLGNAQRERLQGYWQIGWRMS